MSHSLRIKNRKVSPPQPSYMSEKQVADYLSDLRSNRPPRPNGSRPLPTKIADSNVDLRPDMPPRASSALSNTRPSYTTAQSTPSAETFPRSASALSHHRRDSEASSGSGGFTYAQEPEGYGLRRALSPTPSIALSARSPSVATYRERGDRWLEREEARSIRNAMEEMDIMDEERQLYDAAQAEAVELVKDHQANGFPQKNPHAAYNNPELSFANRYRQHLEKGNHSRSQSLGGYGDSNGSLARPEGYRSASDSSTGSYVDFQSRFQAEQLEEHRKSVGVPDDGSTISVRKNGTLRRKGKVNFALPDDTAPVPQRQGSGQRVRTASGDSSKGVFRNPEDFIYEEPEETNSKNDTPANGSLRSVLTSKPRNSLPRGARPLPDRSATEPAGKRPSVFDIHKNPPSRSRNPFYRSNAALVTDIAADVPKDDPVPTKNGIEIRSDDIRAATAMRRKDRSAKLPMPTAVSDRPGRPIVSFDPAWKPQEDKADDTPKYSPRNSLGRDSPRPSSRENAKTSASTPSIPKINVSDEPTVPSITIASEDSTNPSISISAAPPAISEMKPVGDQKPRPLPSPASSGVKSKDFANSRPSKGSRPSWFSPYTRTGVPTATCASCALPISGRIVTASKVRLHPECFTCHHCNTALECVAFYQEAAPKRTERLAATDPADEAAKSPRFYCHLDFHELFSPRCKSCKTPIEGEVIIACGAEWHVGHFFCAECGDPFSPTTPFVEKEGYAWCVNCHSRRTANKCRGCKKPVLDELVVSALGAQWHDHCFVCNECGDGFGPEGRFFVKQGPPKVSSKGRQIGGPVEFAVCEGCEGRRLKA
ncbi:hypothetical protein AJ80_06760 [Polytolypa hystricis UAMH7299]|uniref:LIM zinc-binding domain-containing protein n=1 Tax=Polytolypa hystricis (strain UAMH7299) TaxID=1447883 RepID=A0A2B7XTN1_POLH7|nr:hypothetical protein AJ80_06760 [Polytolypa hystricis UAMH7299]